MRYNYTCTGTPRCKVKNVPAEMYEQLIVCIGDLDNTSHTLVSQADIVAEDRPPPNTDPQEAFLVWEVEHGMFAQVDIKCPLCGAPATKSYADYYFQGYIRGNGYLDKAGCLRDMNLYKMQKDDPYKQYRVSGEADDIIARLKKAGKRGGKTRYL